MQSPADDEDNARLDDEQYDLCVVSIWSSSMERRMRTGFFGSYMDGLPPERIPLSPPALCVLVGDGDDVVETAVAMFGNELIHNCRSSPLEAT